MTITQKILKLGRVLRSGNDQDIANTRQHQCRERVVNHRLVVNRQQALGNRMGHGVETSAGSARQNDASISYFFRR